MMVAYYLCDPVFAVQHQSPVDRHSSQLITEYQPKKTTTEPNIVEKRQQDYRLRIAAFSLPLASD